MKIVHITLGKANPERMNGVNVVVHQLTSAMHALGYSTEVWGISTSQSPDIDRPYIFKGFSCAHTLIQSLNKESNIIVHFHGGFIPVFYSISKHLKSRNISWVITPHGAYLKQSLRKNFLFKKIYLYCREHFLLAHARKIQALSVFENQDIARSNVTTIPNGYTDTNEYLAPQNNEIIFGYIGRLDQKHKGLDLLLKAFALYKSNRGQGQLWIIGDGPDACSLSKYATKGVTFCGEHHGKSKAHLLQQLDVFCHTSRWDAMPMAVLEAGFHGKPLLLSPHTGLSGKVSRWQAGYIPQDNSVSAITGALHHFETLWQSGQLDSYGERAQSMVKNEFNWPVIIKRMATELYGLHDE